MRATRSLSRLVAWLARPVGDCYDENTTVRDLEWYCTEYFDKSAALFMPSGTMSNQVALRALTSPGDEIILHAACHINFFEAAQTATSRVWHFTRSAAWARRRRTKTPAFCPPES
ncbi:beta-eliminating lyase-related protein [Acidisphaera sp. S103]|uniref:beta-eliminating lyase-related protein n=1 Tax=Acidisphaera sp. S103 TaxID=1747223 RepID=UPI00352C0B60